ncbi:MAG TPA: amidohydrolase family protein [Bryobacteraceae bacterium]|jgi:imidazolonepropionase-like amidohydrolase/ABC-type multidrug transport system permease subunit|nr:amidohydrolase family protein [Bryobacteraceae bacterium]
MKPYIAQVTSNLRLMGRDRSVLFFSYMFPLVFFFIFAQMMSGRQSAAAMAQVIAMVIIIGVLGNGFFGAGMRAVQDRETNVLRRFKVAPVGPAPIIVASLASGLVAFLPSVILFFVFARLIYRMPTPANVLSIFLFVCIGVIAFRAMGMIVAAVVNSAQEGAIITQLLYIPMLFLSGATFPVSIMPIWVQTVAQFLPATYLYQGIQSIMIGGQSLAANLLPIAALFITLCVALVVGVKLFRWEKEEKISGRAKLWILAVLAPFLVMGAYQAKTRENIERAKILTRQQERNRTVLFDNVRILVGNGAVIPNGAVLVKNGKIAEVFNAPPSDTKSLDADVIDESGKTLMPGLIDMHVHIGAFGGVYQDPRKYADPNADKRKLAAYLYSGITAVRSTGDWLDNSLKLKKLINSGEYLGAEFFACGPLFTAPGGHPTELLKYMPESVRQSGEVQFIRLPKDAAEARTQVDDLKKAGVDGIKAVLDAGNPIVGSFPRLDTGIYDAIVAEAATDHLPSATHTGRASDVKDAADAGTSSVEHGSALDLIPLTTFAEMKEKGIAYDPTLSVFEAMLDMHAGNPEPLNRSLVQQTAPQDLLAGTRALLGKQKPDSKVEVLQRWVAVGDQNLLNAYKSGVMLITGTDAGNMLVIHGPTVQHEMELWVKAGIPPAVAIQAATYNAAQVLRAGDRIGSIQKGRDATLILLDGDPLQDISNAERISLVMFRGERISRSELFYQDKE